MSSIFIPTKLALVSYSANPAQLLKDKETEEFFVNTDQCKFLMALSQAIRLGNTSVVYNTSTTNANTIKTLLTSASYNYGFDPADISVTTNNQRASEATLTLRWAYV